MTGKRSVFRACHLCEALCGVRIDIEDDRIVKISGDDQHPVSRGYVCPKATALQDIHEDPDRLRVPMVRQGDRWEAVSWEVALDTVADRLCQLHREHGANAIGIYLGNPSVHNWGMMTHGAHLYKHLKTRQRYSATSVDQLPHQLVCHWMYGHQVQVPVPDIDRTSLLVIIGGNPLASNGSLWTVPGIRHRIKALQARGGRLVVIDPRRTETADVADEHHFIRPGTDAALLCAMLQVIHSEGRVSLGHLTGHVEGLDDALAAVSAFTPEWAAPLTGIPAEVIRTLARQISDTPQAAVYGRMGISVQVHGTVCQWAVQLLNLVTGHLDCEGGSMFPSPAIDPVFGPNSKPGHFDVWQTRVRGLPEFGGELPVAALAEEILTPGEGKIHALITGAGNPVLSTPNGRQLDAALSTLDFMVSIDVYLNETTRHAHVILPPTSPLEHDHYDLALLPFATHNFAQYSPPVFDKPAGAMHDWEIFTALGERVAARLDTRPLPPFTPVQMLAMGLAAGPYAADGLSLQSLMASPHGVDLGPLRSRLPDGLFHGDKRIRCFPEHLQAGLGALARMQPAGPFLLIGRRHVRSNNSWMHNSRRLIKGPARHGALIHPEDATRLGVDTGATLRISSRTGVIEVPAVVSDTVMPGVVSVPHGWGHDRPGIRLDVASRLPGASVNDITDQDWLDVISGNAALNGVAVTVEPVAPPDCRVL